MAAGLTWGTAELRPRKRRASELEDQNLLDADEIASELGRKKRAQSDKGEGFESEDGAYSVNRHDKESSNRSLHDVESEAKEIGVASDQETGDFEGNAAAHEEHDFLSLESSVSDLDAANGKFDLTSFTTAS